MYRASVAVAVRGNHSVISARLSLWQFSAAIPHCAWERV